MELCFLIDNQQIKIEKAKEFLKGYGENGNTNQFDTKAARRLASKL